MKKLSLIFFVLSVFLGTVQAQNDTIFILKDGEITGRYKITEIDSIIFYQPAIVDSLNIESTQFLNMATWAANYIDTNQKIPNVSYIDASQTRNVSAAEFYYMMARWLRYLKTNGEQATPPPVRIVRGTAVPPAPTGAMSGTFTKSDILTKGQSNADFIDANGYVPNYSTVDSTQYSPVAIYYAMAKTIRYYVQNNHVLPTSVTITQIDGPDTWPATLGTPTNTDSLNVVNTQFLEMVTRAANYIDTNQQIPNISYIDASQTRSVSAAEFYYMMARWLKYLKNNGEQTPSTVKIIRGTAVPPTPTGAMSGTFTKDEILTKGQSNADFIDANGYVPNYSTVGNTQYSPVAIYYAMAKTIRYYAQNNNTLPTSVNVSQVTGPFSWPATSEKVYLGITTTKLRDAINIAWKSTSYSLSIKKQPNAQMYYMGISVNSSDAASVKNTIASQTGLTFSQGSSDPASGWYSMSVPPSSLERYLNYADGWRVNYTNADIVARANSILANNPSANTVGAMANAIFNWVNSVIAYSYYNNSQKGAWKTLYDGSGNCCDQSNLLVSLFRAAGIPCGFVHGYYKSASSPNHCWTRAYIDGSWVLYDPTSSSHYGDAWFSYYNSW